ncbi:MAG: glycosyltransferase, partial [Gemmatimonadaceae bacterium]
MAELPVSILLRSCNEAWALRDTLPALAAQHYRNWELIAFDSGSSDGSVELLRGAHPRHFVQILPHEYRPGRVLNQGMALSRHDRVIFLNADATPQGPDWLEPLVRALDDPQVAAVFGRQIPRPDCAAHVARDYERCFGANRASAGWDHFFSMVSSGLRRDVWARRAFRETLQYSEDDDYTRWCRSAGYRIGYCPESVVMHSHNYTPRQAYKRSFGEAWALAAGGHDAGPESHPLRAQFLGWAREAGGDLYYCLRTRRLREWLRAAGVRWQQRLGRRHGLPVGRQLREADPPAGARFTLDGDAALERHLALSCARVADGLRALLPDRKLEAVLLGGGYGRGEGGVLRSPAGDRPYNDLDFTVAIQGGRRINALRYQRRLDVFGEILTHQADVEVEFKITSLAEL